MPPIQIATLFSALLPIATNLILFKKIKSWQLWVISFYCLYSFSNDLFILNRFSKGKEISTLLYSFTVVEYLVFATYLWAVLNSKLLKKVLLTVSALFTLYCFFYIVQKPFSKFDSVQTSIEAIVIFSFCIIYLFEQINQPQIIFIYSSYHFWIIIGILIYLAGTFFFFVYASNLSNSEIDSFLIINHISNILKNLLFVIGIITHVKAPKTQEIREYQPFLN